MNPLIEVWRQPDARWRWAYREEGDSDHEVVELLSGHSFETRAAALTSANTAYPDVRVRFADSSDPPETPPAHQRGSTFLGFMAVLLVWLRLRGLKKER